MPSTVSGRIMMNSQQVALGALWGTALGLLYFGGLWLTVRRVHKVAKPRLLLLLSFALRAFAAVSCFLLILQKGPVLFCAAVLFFFLFRFLITGLLGRPEKERVHAN